MNISSEKLSSARGSDSMNIKDGGYGILGQCRYLFKQRRHCCYSYPVTLACWLVGSQPISYTYIELLFPLTPALYLGEPSECSVLDVLVTKKIMVKRRSPVTRRVTKGQTLRLRVIWLFMQIGG